MNKLKPLIDRNIATMAAAEPYFAPSFEAARVLLDGAKVCNDGLHWSSGATCGPHGCSCGNRGCLHQTAWRIYAHDQS